MHACAWECVSAKKKCFAVIWFKGNFVKLFSSAVGQHPDLHMCNYCGAYVILYGWSQTPQGIFGGQAVSGGEAEFRGTESAAGKPKKNLKILWQYFSACSLWPFSGPFNIYFNCKIIAQN